MALEREAREGDSEGLFALSLVASPFIRAFSHSLRSRRLEVMGERENGRAQGRHARGLACLLLARPFFLVPTTSKRLLRRLVLSKLASLARNDELARRPTERRELLRKSEP